VSPVDLRVAVNSARSITQPQAVIEDFFFASRDAIGRQRQLSKPLTAVTAENPTLGLAWVVTTG